MNLLIKKIVFILMLFLFSSNGADKIEILAIDLKQESSNEFYLDFGWVSKNLKSLNVQLFKKDVIESYKGVPMNDSIRYYGNFENTIQFYYDLYNSNKYEKKDFLELITKRNIDTLQFSKKPITQGFISIVGFYKNKQFLIADANRNKDFSDDVKYEYSIDFRKNPLDSLDILNNMPETKYSYEYYDKGKTHIYTRKFILYPSIFESHFIDGVGDNEFLSKYRNKDFWHGTAKINNNIYDFYYQSVSNDFGSIYIKPKKIKFSKTDDLLNEQFMNYTNDTIKIENNRYKIDSINIDISKLYLRKISSNNETYGSRVGENLKNYIIEDLNGGKFSTDRIINSKKYTLIDFWATWCGPCLRLTPVLFKLKNDNLKKLNIISLSVDDNAKVARDYIEKKNIDWKNGYLENKDFNNLLLKDLNVRAYPTLILVDQTGKIIYRGGAESINEIIELIK